ncbi:MAG: insulinase family protein [Cellvibrionaceae bacterium]|nr:insulinase family protein [Cellvibrionaceae bacterium]MCV6626879.1 insulinase family protein [Cellvibrionaceae bacterium]
MSQQPHPAFEALRSQAIDSLNIVVHEYRHRQTGAAHIHIEADNSENVFLVALRTVPEDSTGVAHILEHTALCGSERYPVRDPFFMMIRRSLNTFMNAFTSSDWTAYPFASQNRKDFDNLLDVYLDAVFFSRLDPLDFAQEGHRLEFAEPADASSPLEYKGVVYNEMKGAMSSVPAQLWQALCAKLYPTSTYHYNSGGEPSEITKLSYQQLLAFYKTHYHPSNAIFMTFGDIPAGELQEKFETQALSRFERLDKTIAVQPEHRYSEPQRVNGHYPLDDEDADTNAKTHIVMSWLLGSSTDLDATLEAQLLSSLLFDNSASPLQQALETTDLGNAPSPLCGLDDSQLELSFCCGIEGSEPEQVEALEQLVLGVLEKVASEGLPQQQVEASLHQLELQQREIGGDSYPYGLQLILTGLTAATHRGDVLALLNLEPALDKLRAQIAEPDFVQNLARRLLLDNPHRVTLCMAPDKQLAAAKQQAEQDELAEIKAALSDAQTQAIIEQSQALLERQNQVDDASILPKVGIADVPDQSKYCHPQQSSLGELCLSEYSSGTNGLVYQQIVIKTPELEPELLPLLPYYCMALTELGVGELDYLQNQLRQSQLVGALNAFSSVRGSVHDNQQIDAYITLSAKALGRNQAAVCELMDDILSNVRFDEHQRLAELVAQVRARMQQSVTGNGHSLAMSAASAGISPAAALTHQLSGLAGISAIKAMDDSFSEPSAVAEFAAKLARIHGIVLQAERQYLLIGEAESMGDYKAQLGKHWPTQQTPGQTPLSLPHSVSQRRQAWVTNTQVNFCARAYPTVPSGHADAAALTVLGGFLRNGFLHRAIREQGGAYGGGASQDNNIGAFRFYSYRDPRFGETLADFDRALEWLAEHEHDEQALEEAILGVISALDKPSSPAGEAKQDFHARLHGRSPEVREDFRQRILKVTLDDLQRVGRTYLDASKASTVVICPPAGEREATETGLEIIKL